MYYFSFWTKTIYLSAFTFISIQFNKNVTATFDIINN